MMRILLLICLAVSLDAATIVAASCSSANVQTAIDSAVSGDTVELPAPCTAGSYSISIPSTKGITLDGKGASVSGTISLTPHATVSSRITGFTFTSGTNTLNINGSSLTAARWRVDHCTFTGNGHQIVDFGISPGLFDHNEFTALNGADEFIHNEAWGPGDTTGWTNAHTPGSDEAVYVEDNIFTTPTSEANNAWIQTYYGARMVYRFNTFNYVRIDAHGTAGNVGARWWEVYHNAFVQSGGNAGGSVVNLRAGSGLVFSNTKSGAQLTGNIGLCEEDSGYPANYQIGRGQSQALYPAYGWSNQITVAVDSCEAPEVAGMVQFNRDVYTAENSASCTAGGSCTAGVGIGTTLPTTCTTNTGFWKTNEGEWWAANSGSDGLLYKCTSTDVWTLNYTPYTYPHPLQGGIGATTSSRAGGGIRVTGRIQE